MNAVCGKKKKQVKLVHKCLVADPNSSYESETYVGLLALYQKDSNGKGKCKAINSGLTCYSCQVARKKSSNCNLLR